MLLLRIGVFGSTRQQPDRDAREVELGAQAVDQIALIILGHLLGASAEYDEGRRPRLGLGDVAQLQPAALDQRRLVPVERGFEPPVQGARRYATVPDLMHLPDGRQ